MRFGPRPIITLAGFSSLGEILSWRNIPITLIMSLRVLALGCGILAMTILRYGILLALSFATPAARAQTSPLLQPPPVLYPNPVRSSYPRTAQSATISDFGKMEILPGKTKIEVIFRADSHWMYVCRVPSERYLRGLKRGGRVTIRPDERSVRLVTSHGHLRLEIIDATMWGDL
jgi:hypothetical protein